MMREIKAFVHANRIGDVIAAIKSSSAWQAADGGQHNLAVYLVQGSLLPLSQSEQHFSVQLGDQVVSEYKIELLCEDVHVDELVNLVAQVARTGQSVAGWIYVSGVDRVERIG